MSANRSLGAPGRRWPSARSKALAGARGRVCAQEPPGDRRERERGCDTDPGEQERVVGRHRRGPRPDMDDVVEAQREAAAGELADQREQREPCYLGSTADGTPARADHTPPGWARRKFRRPREAA